VKREELEIPQHVLDELDALPAKKTGAPSRQFSPEEDYLITRYWDKLTRAQLCQALKKVKPVGKTVSESKLLERYRELTQERS